MEPFAIRDALVVDADADLRGLLPRILKPGIWAIQHVPTNQAALQAAKGKSFELVITGEKSSGREDVDLLRKIRIGHPHTRLIILAKESTPAEVLASMREHAFCFFSPPYSLEELGNMIRMATEAPCWDDGIDLLSSTAGCLSPDEIAMWAHRPSVICTVPRGGAIVMRPLVVHASSSCSRPEPRRVVHLEFAADDLPDGLEWHDRV